MQNKCADLIIFSSKSLNVSGHLGGPTFFWHVDPVRLLRHCTCKNMLFCVVKLQMLRNDHYDYLNLSLGF